MRKIVCFTITIKLGLNKFYFSNLHYERSELLLCCMTFSALSTLIASTRLVTKNDASLPVPRDQLLLVSRGC